MNFCVSQAILCSIDKMKKEEAWQHKNTKCFQPRLSHYTAAKVKVTKCSKIYSMILEWMWIIWTSFSFAYQIQFLISLYISWTLYLSDSNSMSNLLTLNSQKFQFMVTLVIESCSVILTKKWNYSNLINEQSK